VDPLILLSQGPFPTVRAEPADLPQDPDPFQERGRGEIFLIIDLSIQRV